MMAKGITEKGEVILRPITLTLDSVFPNLNNLNPKSIEFLNKVDTILRTRVFKTAA